MKKRIFILSGMVVLIDQLIKLLVTNGLQNESGITVINNFLNLTYVENTGAAWGILTGTRWFLVILSVIAIYVIIKYFLLDVNITKVESVAYALMLGGVVGNLIDRVIHGYVIDYIQVYLGNYQFPIFNLADSCMVIGVLLIVIHLVNNAIKQRRLT